MISSSSQGIFFSISFPFHSICLLLLGFVDWFGRLDVCLRLLELSFRSWDWVVVILLVVLLVSIYKCCYCGCVEEEDCEVLVEGSLQGWCVAHCLFSLHTKCLTIFPRETKWYQKLLNLGKGQCFVVLHPPHTSTIKSLKMLKRKDCLKIFFSKKKVIVERLIDIRGFTIPVGQWLQQ